MNLFHQLKLLIISLLLLFQFQHNGVSASQCQKERSNNYKCGSARGDLPIWPVETTCRLNDCCCETENGWYLSGYQLATCTYQDNSKIGCFACGGTRACKYVDNTDVGDSSCTGTEACQDAGGLYVGRTTIGIESCRGKHACYDADGTIGDNSCNFEDACNIAKGVTIGDGSCNGGKSCSGLLGFDYSYGACYNVNDSSIGDGSCNEVQACKGAAGSTIGYGSCNFDEACRDIHGTTIGDGSCNAPYACSSYYEAKVVNVTIGDNSCNADSVCAYCESGSVVPDGTCNDLNNVDEVGTILVQGFVNLIEEKVCRACFAQLRQGDYAVEVSASSMARRRLKSASPARRTLRAMAESDSHCSILAQEMKELVVESLSSHTRFVRFLKGKDLSKKCRKEYLSNVVGVMRDEGIFDNGCKLTIKMNAKLELLKKDEPDFVSSFKEAVGDLMDNIVVDEVMATKMNCEGSGPGPGGKSKKGKSTKSKGGKRGKK